MADTHSQNLRDCAIVVLVKIVGLSYFSLFVLQALLFHFPSSPEEILSSLSIIFFSGGVMFACLSSLVFRILSAFQGEEASDWQKLEFGGILFLIYTATVPAVILQFSTQPPVQLGYLFSFTLIAVENIMDFLVLDLDTVNSNASVIRARFPYHSVSLGLFALVPTIHALTETFHNPPQPSIDFLWFAGTNTLGAIFYLLRPLERMGAFNTWSPGLYIMHLVLIYSSIVYSRDVLKAMLVLSS